MVSILPQILVMTLFIAGLPGDFDEVDFKEMFELYGQVKSARLVIDRQTGKSKGFGFIEMPDAEALETIEALDGVSIKGKQISVKEAEKQTTSRPAPRPNNRFGNSGGGNRYNRNY